MKFRTKSLAAIATAVLSATMLFEPTQVWAQSQYSASDSWEVGPGDYILQAGVPDCGGHEFDAIGAAAQAISAYRMGGVYGSLASVLTTAAREFQPKLGGAAGQILDTLFGANRYANCVPVSVVIPAGARITGIEYQASDWSGSRSCVIGQDCQIGWSRFDPAKYFPAGDSLVITSVFRNWSGDRTRNATMIVYFVN
jgi:hypothetical protein